MMTEDGISGEAPMSTGLTRFTPPPSPCAHPRILVQLPDQVGLCNGFDVSQTIVPVFCDSDMGFFPRSCIYVSRTQSPCSYTLWPLTATVHMSQDPRPQICHESIPGHQTQLAISQRQPPWVGFGSEARVGCGRACACAVLVSLVVVVVVE